MRFPRLIVALAFVSAACGRVTAAAPAVGASIAAGGGISCAIVADGGIACWGDRAYVGAGFTRGDAPIGISPPVAVSLPSGKRFDQVVVSTDQHALTHACALAVDGTAWCWGNNSYGELGDGGASLGDVPIAVHMPASTSFTQIFAGYAHACALDEIGGVWCWGSGDHGQLGDDRNWYEDPYGAEGPNLPMRVPLPEGVLTAELAVGSEHTCALTTTGEVWCWGDDVSYEPPRGPVKIPLPPEGEVSDLVAGYEHTCALVDGGRAWCWYFPWGRDEGNAFEINEPTLVGMPDGVSLTRIVSGSSLICGLSAEQEVWCWSAWESERTPFQIEGALAGGATDVAAGDGHACAIAKDSTVWCWGDNDYGQLGDGTRDPSSDPVQVALDLSVSAPAPVAYEQLPLEPIELEPYTGDSFLLPPPIWSVDMDDTSRVWSAAFGGGWQLPEAWGLQRCRSEESVNEECVYSHLASLGASERALSLLWDHQITVSRVAGTFPVWVAESYDWATFGTNYDGSTPNLIFTPAGIIDLSSSVNGAMAVDLSAAYAAAFASNIDERIEVAAESGFGSPYDLLLGEYSENFDVPPAAPRRTDSGWAVPFSVQSGGGIHCCSYPFWARFELDLNSAGETTGVRFLDWCYVERVTFGSGGIPDEWPKVIRELGATMPACDRA